jgi:ATPase subunit of ABC transporter with duplicated ATPase domains
MSSASVDLRRVGVGYGSRVVLHEVTATIGAGARLAVVGPNGVGKSTLLRLVAGELAPESGDLVRRPPDATVGYLPQERDRRAAETLAGYLGRRTGVAVADATLQAAADALGSGAPGVDDAYTHALDRYLALGGPDLDARAASVLADLGLDPEQRGQAITSLSGGELARAALAAILLSQVDVLLLDEPTNDLDTAGLALLEDFLLRRAGTLVVVSHDRVFLERVTDQVLEIDEFSHEATAFGGGFAAYVVERGRARDAARTAYDDYERSRTSLVERARREKEWARQGIGRATSAKARRDEPDRNVRSANLAGAQSRFGAAGKTVRALDRLEAVEDPREPWDLRMSLSAS